MNILFATSEALPLVKTGGLADVSGTLPRAIKNLRHDIRIVLPAYAGIKQQLDKIETLGRFEVNACPEPVQLLLTRLPGSQVKVYLIDIPEYFDREGNPYVNVDGTDWPDNAQRFAGFARAVVELACNRAGLNWRPEVVHCNDWQTGLIPALLTLEDTRPATLFTIHNLAYQGLFDWSTFQSLDLPARWWSMHALEFHGQISFIKGGLVFADWITTVSPTYADEIQTTELGSGLDGLLRARRDRLRGILNGADYKVWDPARDPYLEAHFTSRDLSGKASNKATLQRQFGLPQDPQIPLLGHIGRLVQQKGADLIVDCLPELLIGRVQMVVLGSGQTAIETALQTMQARYPDKLGVQIGYDEGLAHLIEAGADIFVMPSRFEPCGLNQLYSLRYGTIPVVSRTGGLADTVIDANPAALEKGLATGFQFNGPTAAALQAALNRALASYGQTHVWRRLMDRAMQQDFSWKRSARQYVELYQAALDGLPVASHDSAGNAEDAQAQSRRGIE